MTADPVIIGDATLYCGDCRHIITRLPAVDAVITSPPYNQQRDYGENPFDWTDLMVAAFDSINVAEDGQLLINLGQSHRAGEVVTYWEPWRDYMRAAGWRFFGWYIWDQGAGLPGDWGGRLAPSHEHILHFNKKAKPLNKWTPTRSRETPKTGLRRRDGTVARLTSPHKCGQATKVADSVIRVYRDMKRNGPEVNHPATFPETLPTALLKSFTRPGEIVLDMFAGSGTTGVACLNNGRRFIGIEQQPEYFKIMRERVEGAASQLRLFA